MPSLDSQVHPFCGWVTISDIHQTLGSKVNTLLRVVLRAKTAGQEWIKLEQYPTPQDRPRWLIDTDSAEYHYHERRGCKRIADALNESTQQLIEDIPLSGTPATPSEIQAAWTQLCSLVANLGLVRVRQYHCARSGLAMTMERKRRRWIPGCCKRHDRSTPLSARAIRRSRSIPVFFPFAPSYHPPGTRKNWSSRMEYLVSLEGIRDNR